jgi:hypothetical protein
VFDATAPGDVTITAVSANAAFSANAATPIVITNSSFASVSYTPDIAGTCSGGSFTDVSVFDFDMGNTLAVTGLSILDSTNPIYFGLIIFGHLYFVILTCGGGLLSDFCYFFVD